MSDGKRPEGDLGLAGKVAIVTGGMTQRINRAIELLAQDQAIYYIGGHSGHVLTRAQGREDAGTWADYVNVGMEHGAFDMTGLAEYMAGLVEAARPVPAIRTPAVIVEAPVNGTDAANVRFNAWQFRQILGRGAHGILLCQAEAADAVRAFVESCRYPHHRPGSTPACRPRSSACAARCGSEGAARSASAPAAAARRRPRRRSGGSRPRNISSAASPGRSIPRANCCSGSSSNRQRASPIARRSSLSPASALPNWGRAISACRSATSRCRASPTPPRCARPANGFRRLPQERGRVSRNLLAADRRRQARRRRTGRRRPPRGNRNRRPRPPAPRDAGLGEMPRHSFRRVLRRG